MRADDRTDDTRETPLGSRAELERENRELFNSLLRAELSFPPRRAAAAGLTARSAENRFEFARQQVEEQDEELVALAWRRDQLTADIANEQEQIRLRTAEAERLAAMVERHEQSIALRVVRAILPDRG